VLDTESPSVETAMSMKTMLQTISLTELRVEMMEALDYKVLNLEIPLSPLPTPELNWELPLSCTLLLLCSKQTVLFIVFTNNFGDLFVM